VARPDCWRTHGLAGGHIRRQQPKNREQSRKKSGHTVRRPLGYALRLAPSFASLNIETGPAVDDPGKADIGVLKPVIADGPRHVYQWDFTDDSQ